MSSLFSLAIHAEKPITGRVLTPRFLALRAKAWGYQPCNLLQNSCASLLECICQSFYVHGNIWSKSSPHKLSATVTASNNEYVFILNGSFLESCMGVTVGPANDDAACEVSPDDLDETASGIDDSAGNRPCPAVTREGRVDAIDFSGVAAIAP